LATNKKQNKIDMTMFKKKESDVEADALAECIDGLAHEVSMTLTGSDYVRWERYGLCYRLLLSGGMDVDYPYAEACREAACVAAKLQGMGLLDLFRHGQVLMAGAFRMGVIHDDG